MWKFSRCWVRVWQSVFKVPSGAVPIHREPGWPGSLPPWLELPFRDCSALALHQIWEGPFHVKTVRRAFFISACSQAWKAGFTTQRILTRSQTPQIELGKYQVLKHHFLCYLKGKQDTIFPHFFYFVFPGSVKEDLSLLSIVWHVQRQGPWKNKSHSSRLVTPGGCAGEENSAVRGSASGGRNPGRQSRPINDGFFN